MSVHVRRRLTPEATGNVLTHPLFVHILIGIQALWHHTQFDTRAGNHRPQAGLNYTGSAGPIQPLSLNKTKLSAPQHISHICDGQMWWEAAGLDSPDKHISMAEGSTGQQWPRPWI